MTDSTSNPVPKIHPATRPVEPEDPMNLHAFEVPGNTELMLRVVVEEYARMGCDLDSMMNMFRDPFYQVLHGLWQLYGEDELHRRVIEILGRCGIMRTTTIDTAPPSDQLVQLDIPDSLLVSKTPDELLDGTNTVSVDSRECCRPSQPCKGANDDA